MSLIPKKGTVYVVDDDEAVRDSLQWLLEGKDYRVRCFDSAESFISRYDLQLFSNFTYWLSDPARGDQFEQQEQRWLAGGSARRDWSFSLGSSTKEANPGTTGATTSPRLPSFRNCHLPRLAFRSPR
jgi:hypothetical protein